MSRAARLYFWCVCLTAAALLIWTATHTTIMATDLPLMLGTGLLIIVLSYGGIGTALDKHSKVVTDISEIGKIFLIPTVGQAGIFAVGFAVLFEESLRQYLDQNRGLSWHKTLFNSSINVIVYWLGLKVYLVFISEAQLFHSDFLIVLAILAVGFTFFITNTSLLIPILVVVQA